MGKASLCYASFSYELQFVSRLLHFWPSSPLMAWVKEQKLAQMFGSFHVGDLEQVLNSWFWPGSVLVVEAVRHLMKDPHVPLPLSLYFLFPTLK